MKLHRLPEWYPFASAMTFYSHVWVKDSRKGDLDLLRHEEVHTKQQMAHPVWFWVSYLLLLPLWWNPWRTKWEAEAFAQQIHSEADLVWAAKALSGWNYGWTCTYEMARDEIKKWVKP